MKRILTFAAMLLVSLALNAQNVNFLGKWNVAMKNLPMVGDTEMVLELAQNEDGSYKGHVCMPDGTSKTDISDIKVTEKTLSFCYFQYMTIDLSMTVQEDGTVTGYVMGQYPLTATKAK